MALDLRPDRRPAKNVIQELTEFVLPHFELAPSIPQDESYMNYPNLFTPLLVGAITVPNRVFMAPMTRARSTEPGDIPTPLMAEYYRQRASAGLIITEATQVSFQAKGWSGAPGIHTNEQIAGWSDVVQKVHASGGKIAVQIWHTGRLSHTEFQPDNAAPVAPSVVPADAIVRRRDADGQIYTSPPSMPRALETSEIAEIVADFGQATANAREAGFDLVELHGAHGYLIQQFLSPKANQRTDHYGGSIENRARFALEVVDAAIAQWSSDRIGFRMFPIGELSGITNSDNQEEEALYLIRELAKRKLAYLHLSEPDWVGGASYSHEFRQAIRGAYPGVIIAAGSYTPEKGNAMIGEGLIDAVAFGRPFMSNPDLPVRYRTGAALNESRKEDRYGNGAEGYIDYPSLRATAEL